MVCLPTTMAVASENIWSKKLFADLFIPSKTTTAVPSFKPSSQYKGEPAIFFEEEEIGSLAASLHNCLIGKFSYGKVLMEVLRKEFHKIDFKGSSTIGCLDPRHVLIRRDL